MALTSGCIFESYPGKHFPMIYTVALLLNIFSVTISIKINLQKYQTASSSHFNN